MLVSTLAFTRTVNTAALRAVLVVAVELHTADVYVAVCSTATNLVAICSETDSDSRVCDKP